LAQGTTIETFGRGPVDYALAKPGAVITLLPATGSSAIGVAVFRQHKRNAAVPVRNSAPPQRNVESSAHIRAGGFLGLSDEPEFEEEPATKKAGWWRKLWDE
jgi:hypothetical protein